MAIGGSPAGAPRAKDGSRGAAGRFVFVAEVARGYMGALWVARDVADASELGTVHVRHVTPLVAASARAAILEGARWAMAGADSPSFEVLEGRNAVDLVTPFVESEPLRSLLRTAAVKHATPEPEVLLGFAQEWVRSLGALHERARGTKSPHAYGAVHPDSVLIDLKGHVHLVDVGSGGAASAREPWRSDPQRIGYAAPEQLETRGIVDARTDVFAVGIALWEALANRRLFPGNDAKTARDRVQKAPIARLDATRPSAAPGVSTAIADLVARCLERDPAARFQTMEELDQALSEIQTATSTRIGSWVASLAESAIVKRRQALERAATGAPPLRESVPPPSSGRPSFAPARATMPTADPAASTGRSSVPPRLGATASAEGRPSTPPKEAVTPLPPSARAAEGRLSSPPKPPGASAAPKPPGASPAPRPPGASATPKPLAASIAPPKPGAHASTPKPPPAHAMSGAPPPPSARAAEGRLSAPPKPGVTPPPPSARAAATGTPLPAAASAATATPMPPSRRSVPPRPRGAEGDAAAQGGGAATATDTAPGLGVATTPAETAATAAPPETAPGVVSAATPEIAAATTPAETLATATPAETGAAATTPADEPPRPPADSAEAIEPLDDDAPDSGDIEDDEEEAVAGESGQAGDDGQDRDASIPPPPSKRPPPLPHEELPPGTLPRPPAVATEPLASPVHVSALASLTAPGPAAKNPLIRLAVVALAIAVIASAWILLRKPKVHTVMVEKPTAVAPHATVQTPPVRIEEQLSAVPSSGAPPSAKVAPPAASAAPAESAAPGSSAGPSKKEPAKTPSHTTTTSEAPRHPSAAGHEKQNGFKPGGI